MLFKLELVTVWIALIEIRLCVTWIQTHPCRKTSIYWLGMFWSMAAGLRWSLSGLKQLAPAQDQLKPAAMLQNIPDQYMLFFQQGY